MRSKSKNHCNEEKDSKGQINQLYTFNKSDNLKIIGFFHLIRSKQLDISSF